MLIYFNSYAQPLQFNKTYTNSYKVPRNLLNDESRYRVESESVKRL